MSTSIRKSVVICILAALAWSAPVGAKTKLVIGGSGTDLETFRIIGRAFSQVHPQVSVRVLPSIGSRGAVLALAAGEIDLGLMSRAMKDTERRPGLTSLPYGRTPLVFAVHDDHDIKGVDMPLLRAIYTGTGDSLDLRPILRPKADSDTLVLQAGLPEFTPALHAAYERPGVPVTMTDQTTVDLLASTPNVIGTTSLSILLTEPKKLKPLSLNGVSPTVDNLANGAYPLAKTGYFLYREPLSAVVKSFVDFVYSPKGRRILEQTGHQFIGPMPSS